MKKKRLYVAMLSLLLAVGAAGSMLWYANGADARAMTGIEGVGVFVANSEIPAGTTLSDAIANDWLRIEQIPRRLAPEGSGTEVDPANASNVASSDIHAGELVLLSRFVPRKQISAGLAIPVGKVALALNLEDPQRVGNFVRVGAKIAVFSTDKVPAAGSANTELLLSDLLVLGVGDSTGDAEKSEPGSSKLITVAVTQAEAELLIQATTEGTLYLALMNEQSGIAPTSPVAPSPTTAPVN